MKKMFLLMLVLCTALGTRGSVDLSDLDKALSIQSENTVTTTVTNLGTAVQNFITNNGEDKLKKLVITSGELSQEKYEYIADIKSLELLDLTNATLPDDVRLTDPSKHTMKCQVLIFPDGTKIAPNFECFPNLKVAMGGGLKKIWLVSQKGKKDGTGGTITNAFDEVKKYIPQAIKNMDATARIGVAFVGEVTVDDVKSMVGSGAPLSNAGIWHFHAAKNLTEDNIKSLFNSIQNNPTGFVLPSGMSIDNIKGNEYNTDAWRIGNIYSLSTDEKTLSVLLQKTGTFDIARFATTETGKVIIKSGGYGKVPLDNNIINAIKGTKYAKSIDISDLDAPKNNGTPQPFWSLLQDVKSGTVEYIRIPATDSFDPTKYEGTTFGAIARMKDGVAVVYQRVPNTLYKNKEYRSTDIITNQRIRYRGMMNENDIKNILQDNTNEYFDLSDVKMVKYIDTKNWDISPKDFKNEMVEDLSEPDMSLIKNDKVKYLALPVGTKLPDVEKIKTNCPSLYAMGVINDAKEPTETKNKNTISIHSWQEGSTAAIVDMLTDYTDFPEFHSSTNAVQNVNDINTENVSYGVVSNIVMSGKLNFCDIAASTNQIDADGHFISTETTGTETTLTPAFNNGTTHYSSIFGSFKTADFTNAIFPNVADMTFSAAGRFNKVTEIKLPTSQEMTEIPNNCLNMFEHVTELCIPANYKIIGEGAFYQMTGLTKMTTTPSGAEGQTGNVVDRGTGTIVLPYYLEKIKKNAFWGINKMYDIYVLAEKTPKCEKDAFPSTMCFGNNGFHNVHPVQRINYKNGDNVIGMLHYPRACKGTVYETYYTDITREYTLLDETGATNGYGQLISWPTHDQFRKAYEQAGNGVLWDDKTTYDTDYAGWHQFTLAESYYRKRALETAVRDYSRFKENDWYTICVPYNITRSTLTQILGAKKDEQVTYKNADGTTVTTTVKDEDGLCPDVRTLVQVKRKSSKNLVTFVFSENLATKEVNGTKGADVKLSEDGKTYEYVTPEMVTDDNDKEDPIIIKGGYPYIIKPYLSEDRRKKLEEEGFLVEIPKNIGTNPFGYTVTGLTRDVATAAPYPNHKVHAIDEDNTTETETKYVYEGGNENTPYFYHFIGTYSYKKDNYMPQYSFFLGKSNKGNETHKFYRVTQANKRNWARYSAIMAGRSEGNINISDDADKENITLNFTCDDDYFGADSGDTPVAAMVAMSFGGDEGDGTTGIAEINRDNRITNNNVYSLSGKCMGKSTNNLPKGIYIMNGKKFVVK